MFKPAKRLLDGSKACQSFASSNGLPYSASRYFSVSRHRPVETRDLGKAPANKGETTYDDAIAQEQGKQAAAPWHREGSEQPPVRRQRSASAMTKGKLLTTPSRLLKLIIPLTTADHNTDRKSVQPLALLVHPQQPLSYLERLIQSELPVVTTEDKKQKIPAVHFKAEDFATDEIKPEENKNVEEDDEEQGDDAVSFEGKIERTGKITSEDEEGKYEKKSRASIDGEDGKAKPEGSSKLSPEDKGENAAAGARQDQAHKLRGGPGEGGVEYYSGAGRERETESEHSHRFVRWSSSTEIGDFIRDAARGKEFAVEIEGAEKEIRVGVPSFNDRTHYLRTRLRKMSRRIADMAHIKTECDKLAHKSAQWVAVSGFGIMVGWWGLVYYLTFQTDLGWDVMEPVTYLVGLSTVICGALWFLYHNREVSYRSALSLTVSRRQNQLYNAKGFDLAKWEALVQEANSLRAEIKNVANEYDVEWDERTDEHDETVTKAMKEEREAKKSKKEEQEEKEEGKD